MMFGIQGKTGINTCLSLLFSRFSRVDVGTMACLLSDAWPGLDQLEGDCLNNQTPSAVRGLNNSHNMSASWENQKQKRHLETGDSRKLSAVRGIYKRSSSQPSGNLAKPKCQENYKQSSSHSSRDL